MFDWDIDQFPLKTGVRRTPAQEASDKWLNENSDESFDRPLRPVQPGDLDRLTEQHENDPADRNFGVPTSGGGHERERYDTSHYPTEGYNQPDRSYPGEGEEGGVWNRPGMGSPEGESVSWLPGFRPLRWADEDDGEDETPDEYHIVTRPRDAVHGLNVFDEHPYHAFGHAYTGTPDSAMDMFAEDHPEYDTERYPDTATHEIIHAHSPEDHDIWHNQLRSEDEAFNRIAQHGFSRESPDVPGHMAYRHIDPHGGVHRLWHNHTNYENVSPEGTGGLRTAGPGWRTSYWQSGHPADQQVPWTFHDDDQPGDSLSDALDRVERNKAHADVVHSDTGLKPVENLYGRHYTSRRPNGTTQQLLYNQSTGDGSNNWMLAHYHPEDSTQHTVTYHGADLPGALEQARRNLARG